MYNIKYARILHTSVTYQRMSCSAIISYDRKRNKSENSRDRQYVRMAKPGDLF